MKSELLKLSKINPQLKYSHTLAKELSASPANSKELIEFYFNNQPQQYASELLEHSLINNTEMAGTKILCVVCCYNETNNIPNIIQNYAKQVCPVDFEVCFIINFEEDESSFDHDYDNFINTIDILIEYKKQYSWINIVAKQFKTEKAGLGRARKYGIDYCLYRLKNLSSDQIDNSVIISNEGDTLSLNSDYFSSYYYENIKNKYRLIQGLIDYPDFVKNNRNIVYDYISLKEKIHLQLGLNNEFSAFGGIMPIGRNFSIHPKLAVKIGSIDPIYRKGTDDDINLGLDITNLINRDCKIFRPIPLVTNPRREIILINEYLLGKWENGKKMYESFHTVKYIYDYNLEEIISLNNSLNDKYEKDTLNGVTNDLFLWVFRSVAKSYLINEGFILKIIRLHKEHLIGYWQMENEIMEFIINFIKEHPRVREKILLKAFSFFNNYSPVHINKLSINSKGTVHIVE